MKVMMVIAATHHPPEHHRRPPLATRHLPTTHHLTTHHSSPPPSTLHHPPTTHHSPLTTHQFLYDVNWANSGPLDESAWWRRYATERYGWEDPRAELAWEHLAASVYGEHQETDANGGRGMYVGDSHQHHADSPLNMATLVHSWAKQH
jgi:hypothetical protein